MRAVALSDKRNIEFLNKNFINTWVLNTDLKRLRDAQGMDAIPPLARTIMQGRKKYSPVDCLIISPKLEFLGRQPVNELDEPSKENYRTFLVKVLEGKRPGLWEGNPTSQ